MSLRSSRRCASLLRGSAGLALSTMLATGPASAQLAPIQASGQRVLATDQSSHSGLILADGSATAIQNTIAGPAQDTAATISDNAISAQANGNRTIDTLTPGELVVSGDPLATRLEAGAGGVVATGDTIVASNQRLIGSTIESWLAASRISLDAGSVGASKLAVTANSQETDSLGNDGATTLTLSDAAGGGGIVTLQKTDAASPIAARSLGTIGMTAQGVESSDLSLTGNQDRAFGTGNQLDNVLSVTGLTAAPQADATIASIVPTAAMGGDPMANAGYAVLSNQETGATIKARSGDDTGIATYGITLVGPLGASSSAIDGNAVVAAATANQSANALDLKATNVTGGSGALANITGVQRIDDNKVVGVSFGGAIGHVLGTVSGSRLSASQNSLRTQATGNLATGNLLTINTGMFDTSDGVPPRAAVGTVAVSDDGTASVTAPVSVLGVQDFGRGSVRAVQYDGAVQLLADAGAMGSSLLADDNVATGAATGNSAVNNATLNATLLRTAVDVGNVQIGDGLVQVEIGSPSSRAGAIIAPKGLLAASSLSVSGNTTTGSAVGSNAANGLTVAANGFVEGGSGPDAATAGPVAGGYGAAADLALANNQKLGQPSMDGSSTAHVSSAIYGRFGVGQAGSVDHSAIVVDGNAQRATAIGNTAVDRLAVSATNLGGDGAPAPGSALSSAQYGQAAIAATSDLALDARGDLSASSASLSGNSNQALAAINDVDNGLAIDTTGVGSVSGGDARVDVGSLGSATITGDHVLASTQFATGSAAATARTSIANGTAVKGFDASSFTIANDATTADASANRAINAVSVASAAMGGPNAGLANSQMSDAAVTGAAITDANYMLGTTTDAAVQGSSIAIGANSTSALARGNVADNQLVLTGAAATGAASPVSAQVGRFDTSADAAALLVNGQSNYGAVTASAASTGYGVPLNLLATPVTASTVNVSGNTVSAAAYGNAAANQLSITPAAGRPATAALVNVQANYGPITAQVTSAAYRVAAGSMAGSVLSITGNQIGAAATGNQATNVVTAIR